MNTATPCPQKDKLVDYLLGKLPVVEQESCELHIVDCTSCEDTIRNLKVTDTLDELTCQAMADPGESTELKLVEQLVGKVRNLSSDAGQEFDRLTLERSAEVVRFLALSEDPSDIGRIAHYRLLHLLGAGSTGVVYEAFDEQLDRTVALKILRPSLGATARSRFLTEAKTAAAVDHRNVITIFQVGEEGQSEPGKLAFMAMQLLPGETLEARLKRDVFLKEELVRKIGAQIADGLTAAHAKDLIHRDIKPANIWLDENDNVKILDFGLARIVDDDPGFTSTGMIAGTPCYMSPEQSKGMPLDGRTDLFSLGCLLYRSATGRQPFGAANVLSTLQAIQNTNPTPPAGTNADVSQELSDLSMGLLEKLPVNRPESAGAVAHALRNDRAKWQFAIPEYEASTDSKASARAKTKASPVGSGMSWWSQLATVVALGMLGLGGFMFGGDIIRIVTGHGQLTIKTDDPDVKIELLENGKLVRIIDTKTDKKIDIREGKYQLQVEGEDNSIQIQPTDLTMTRGGKEIVRVTSSETQTTGSESGSKKHSGLGGNIDSWSSTSSVAQALKANRDNIAAQRAGLKNQLKKLSAKLSEAERATNIEYVSAEIELAEFNTELSVREFRKKISPGSKDIVNVHSSLLEFNELLKTRIAVNYGDSSKAKAFVRGLRTRKVLATRQLQGIETGFDLPSSQPLYDGKTLEQYLEIANTERSWDEVDSAYAGIAALSDQFYRREEFVAFVKNAIVLHPTFGNLNSLTSVLESKEFNGIVISLVAEGTEKQQGALWGFLGNASNVYVIRDHFSDVDPVFEAMMSEDSKPANRLINFLVNKFYLPKAPATREKLEAHLLNLLGESDKNQQMDAALSLVILQPDTEGLAEQAKQIFAESKKNGFALVSKFPAGSANARKTVPLLVEMTQSLDKTQQATVAIKHQQHSLKTWEYASKILSDYGDSVLDLIEDELQSSPQGTKVVREIISWRKREGKPHEELDKLLIRLPSERTKGEARFSAGSKRVKLYNVNPGTEIYSRLIAMMADEDVQFQSSGSNSGTVVVGNERQLELVDSILKVLANDPGFTVPNVNKNEAYFAAYRIKSNAETALSVLSDGLKGTKAKLDQDQETGTIFLLADDAQHKKVRDLIKTLDDSE